MKTNSARLRRFVLASIIILAARVHAQTALETKPDDPYFACVSPVKAPAPGPLYLQPGDRLAIIGDSITEQKIYSRIIETYLTVCVPELKVTARQYGWSGETADGFTHRITNDCLRFKPTIATTCYGMNDFKYRPYDDANAKWYEDRYSAVAQSLKAAGARVVLGSPGCIGKIASWVKTGGGTLDAQNESLCKFRNIDIGIAAREGIRFADVFWPMYTARFNAMKMYGTNYFVAGNDGVHPGGAGHTIMAYAYLKALGLDGDLGTITVDLKKGSASATGGHTVTKFENGTAEITSTRYPFCAAGETNNHNQIRSGMTLVPFNEDLNRLRLVVVKAGAPNYKVIWGNESRTYTGAQLSKGINLAADFAVNPFSAAFKKVDDAVGAKQAYETKQIKQIFHGPEGKDMNAAVEKTEAERAPFAAAIQSAMVPVIHTLKIEAQ